MLTRPSDLEIYLGDNGIFFRTLVQQEALVGAGDDAEPLPGPGTALYLF